MICHCIRLNSSIFSSVTPIKPLFFAYFQIREALDGDNNSGNHSYLSLIQSITLYNRKLIPNGQLMDTARVLLQRYPELWRQFRDMFNVGLVAVLK